MAAAAPLLNQKMHGPFRCWNLKALQGLTPDALSSFRFQDVEASSSRPQLCSCVVPARKMANTIEIGIRLFRIDQTLGTLAPFSKIRRTPTLGDYSSRAKVAAGWSSGVSEAISRLT